MNVLKKLWDELWNRVVVGYKSTLTGLGLAVLIVLGDQAYQWLGGLHQTWAPIAASLVALALATLKSRKSTADAEAEKEIAKGHAVAWMLPGMVLAAFLIALAFALAPARAHASDLARWDDVKIGSLNLGTVTASPTAYVGLLQVDLKTGDTTSSASPGVGLELRLNAGTAKELGLGVVGSMTSGGSVAPGLTLSFLQYGVVAVTVPFQGIDGAHTLGHALLYLGGGLTF